jgi:hypothetical protein
MLISAEIRWFWRDACPPTLHAWFHGLAIPTGGGAPRTDQYLLGRGETELGIKRRGENEGIEIKGLIGVLPGPSELCPHIELWGKWQSQMPLLSEQTVAILKTRRLRKLDTSSPQAVEIPLCRNEKPKTGALPEEGCNIELTAVQPAGRSHQWWTLGFEAFGSLQTAPRNLDRAIAHAVSQAMPPLDGALNSYPAWLAEQYPSA